MSGSAPWGALLHLSAALAGAVTGIASVAVYRSSVGGLPAGLLLVLATVCCALWALGQLRRHLVASYALGWLVVFGLVLAGRPEGDYAVVSDLRGYILVAAGFLLAAVGVFDLASARASHPSGVST